MCNTVVQFQKDSARSKVSDWFYFIVLCTKWAHKDADDVEMGYEIIIVNGLYASNGVTKGVDLIDNEIG